MSAHDDSRTGTVGAAAWLALARRVLKHRGLVALLLGQAVLTALTDASFPLVTRRAVDDLVAHGVQARLLPHALAWAALMIVLAACVTTFVAVAGKLTALVAHDIRSEAFARLHELPIGWHDRHAVGWLMARMTSDCDRLSRVLSWGMLDLAWGGTLIVAILGMLLVLDLRLGLLVGIVLPALALVSLRFQRRMLGSARQVRRQNSLLTAAFNEGVAGVRTTKAMACEPESLGRFGGLASRMEELSVRNAALSALYLPVVLSLGSVATALALWAGGLDVAAGALSVGTLVLFVHHAGRLFEPVQELATLFANLQTAQAAAERVLGLLATEPDVKDSPAVAAAVAAWAIRERGDGVAEDGGRQGVGRIELRDVWFAYGDGAPVLRGIDLDVRTGQTIALVGPTGGGKSTLVSLVCRFREPTRGSILLDGVDYRQRSLAWWQRRLGVVLQEPWLFSGTVRENVRYGRLEATDEDVDRALRTVGAEDLLRDLPDGLDTDVGEGGRRLSTGQKQLVSFARAVLADPAVLVMDEATSSVDTLTERRIQEAMRRVLAGRTAFVIAHRLSTVRDADVILFVDAGRIVECGTHAELLAARGRYHALLAEQHLGARTWAAGDPGMLGA